MNVIKPLLLGLGCAALIAGADPEAATIPQTDGTILVNEPAFPHSESLRTVACRRIVYLSSGLKIEGFVLRPAAAEGRLPVVIFNHGGNSHIGSLDERGLARLCWLAEAGYVVVASQYRGCGASEGHDEMGGADVLDVLNLLPAIEKLDYADATHIGMMGWSRGGMMTFLAMAGTDRLSAAVVGSAPTDLHTEVKNRPQMEQLLARTVPNFASDREAALNARSVQRFAGKLCKTTPVLLLHGRDDNRCDPAEALETAGILFRTDHPFRFIFFESGGHGLTKHNRETQRQILDWFGQHLGKRSRQGPGG